MVRINERYEAIRKAYERYAPRYKGDDEFDVRTLFTKIITINDCFPVRGWIELIDRIQLVFEIKEHGSGSHFFLLGYTCNGCIIEASGSEELLRSCSH